MSGPKSSYYRLSTARSAYLAEQRRIEAERERQRQELHRKCVNELGKIQVDKDKLCALCDGFGDYNTVSSELSHNGIGDGGMSEKVNAFIAETQKWVNSIHAAESDGLESLTSTREKCDEKANSANITSQDLHKILDENRSKLDSIVKQRMDSRITASFADLNVPSTKHECEASKLLAGIRDEVKTRQQSSDIPDTYKKELEMSLEWLTDERSVSEIKTYYEIKIVPLMKKCDSAAEDFLRYNEEYGQLQDTYIALCNLLGMPYKITSCNAEGVSFLSRENKRLSDLYASYQEEEYIASAVDEVMHEMGYDIIGYRNAKKKSGTSIHHELYRYGNGSAVDVTFADDGKISMELGKLDTSDRTPDETEALTMCTEMERFCSDYLEFERRLAEKGILVSKGSKLPPDVAYAQIINVNDYETSEENISANATETRRNIKKKQLQRNEV